VGTILALKTKTPAEPTPATSGAPYRHRMRRKSLRRACPAPRGAQRLYRLRYRAELGEILFVGFRAEALSAFSGFPDRGRRAAGRF